jgi:iron complex outermembrane recepter protein
MIAHELFAVDFVKFPLRYRPADLPRAKPRAGLRLGTPADNLVGIHVRRGVAGRGTWDMSAALAYTRWLNIQADTLNINAEPTTVNLGDGRIYSLDVALGLRPARGLNLEIGALYNDNRITQLRPGLMAATGVGLPNVARFNGRLAAQYHFKPAEHLNMRLSTAARYVGKSSLGTGEILGRQQGGWFDLGLNLQTEIGRQLILAGVTNLLDTRGNRFALGPPFTLDQRSYTTPVRPRTIYLVWELRP